MAPYAAAAGANRIARVIRGDIESKERKGSVTLVSVLKRA